MAVMRALRAQIAHCQAKCLGMCPGEQKYVKGMADASFAKVYEDTAGLVSSTVSLNTFSHTPNVTGIKPEA